MNGTTENFREIKKTLLFYQFKVFDTYHSSSDSETTVKAVSFNLNNYPPITDDSELESSWPVQARQTVSSIASLPRNSTGNLLSKTKSRIKIID